MLYLAKGTKLPYCEVPSNAIVAWREYSGSHRFRLRGRGRFTPVRMQPPLDVNFWAKDRSTRRWVEIEMRCVTIRPEAEVTIECYLDEHGNEIDSQTG